MYVRIYVHMCVVDIEDNHGHIGSGDIEATQDTTLQRCIYKYACERLVGVCVGSNRMDGHAPIPNTSVCTTMSCLSIIIPLRRKGVLIRGL